MLDPALRAEPRWWGGRTPATVVAQEVVGPDAIADLVAVRFDEIAVARRRDAGIAPVVDRVSVMACLHARRGALTTTDLSTLCRIGLSGMRRAISVAVDAGALVRDGHRHYRTHPFWSVPAGRIVAVELKLDNALAAIDQASAYTRWSHVSWVALARVPSLKAIELAEAYGVGLGVLGAEGTWSTMVRPHIRRRANDPSAAAWITEQVLAAGHG